MGDRVARELGINTWAIVFEKVRSCPLTSAFWHQMLEPTDESQVEAVLVFAESTLPLAEIATGAAEELGLGPKFQLHDTVGWLLQALERFPGHRWLLIAAGLQSPVVRNRNMALRAFKKWSRDLWPAEVRADEDRSAEDRLAELRLTQVRPDEGRLARVGLAQVRPAEVYPGEDRVGEVHAPEIRLREVRNKTAVFSSPVIPL